MDGIVVGVAYLGLSLGPQTRPSKEIFVLENEWIVP